MRNARSVVGGAALAWALAVLLAVSAGAQQKKAGLDDETLFEMETASNPAISPDGK